LYQEANLATFILSQRRRQSLQQLLFTIQRSLVDGKSISLVHVQNHLLQACFGPNEKVDVHLIHNGKKLPCFYEYNQWGNIDYWCVSCPDDAILLVN